MKTESTTLELDSPIVESWQVERLPSSPALRPGASLRPAPDWLDRGKIPGLDGLRAIAVILVMLTHSYRTPGFPAGEPLHTISVRGYFGVDVFFVISGFLITTLLAREIDRTGRVDLKRFFTRRLLRILPAYATLMIVVAIGQWLGKIHLEFRDWMGALTYTTNFLYRPSWELGHSWSLAIEEHFYLLWPLALFAGGIVGGWRTVGQCVVGCWLARCVVALVVPHFCSSSDATYYASMAESWTFTRLDTIAVGCLLALACRVDHWRNWLDRMTHPVLMFVYLVVICLSIGLTHSAKYLLCASYTVNAVCVALMMWGMIRSTGVTRSLLNHPIVCAIGMASYSIYLWQQLFINPHSPGWIHEFPQNVVLAFGAAFVSYWLIERPFNQLKDRVAH